MAADISDISIKSVQASIGRTHLAWIANMIIAFAFFGGMYMQRLNYTVSRVERRDLLLKIIDADLVTAPVDQIAADLHVSPSRLSFLSKAIDGEISELGYVHEYVESTNEAMRSRARSSAIMRNLKLSLRSRVEAERDELQRLGNQLDTIEIPGVPIKMATSDLGVLGALALTAAAFWLLANLRNTHEGLVRLLDARKDAAGKWHVETHPLLVPRTNAEAIYQSVANSSVFMERARTPWMGHGFEATLFFPMILTFGNCANDMNTMISKGLYSWHVVRWGFGAAIAVCASVFSIAADATHRANGKILHEWKENLSIAAAIQESPPQARAAEEK